MSNWTGLSEAELVAVGADSVAKVSDFKQTESGVHDCIIDMAYIRKTDSGAEMFELKATSGEDKINWSTCTKSGDAKGNKTTWTVEDSHSDFTKKKYGVGTEVPLPGFAEIEQLMNAVGTTSSEQAPEVAQIEHGRDATVIDAKVFKTLSGLKLKICTQQFEELYNGNVNVKSEVKMFLDEQGNNSEGKEMAVAFTAKVARKPLIELPKSNVPANANADAQATGW